MSIFICGTDTGAGKTYTAAALLSKYRNLPNLKYWKPVQTGTESDPLDEDVVRRLTGLSDSIVPTSWKFKEPLSPHRAAELESRTLSVSEILKEYQLFSQKYELIVEGAGGLLVPINRKETWIDFLNASRLPVLISARSGLGTINHSMLTIQELKRHGIKIAGIVFCGEDNPDNRKTVCEMSGLKDSGPFFFPETYDSVKFDTQKFDTSGDFEQYIMSKKSHRS